MKEAHPGKTRQNRSVSCLSPHDPGLICAGMESEIGLLVPGSSLSELKKEEDMFHKEQETSFSSLRGSTECFSCPMSQIWQHLVVRAGIAGIKYPSSAPSLGLPIFSCVISLTPRLQDPVPPLPTCHW